MTSTALLTPPDAPGASGAHVAGTGEPRRDGVLDELVPLIGVIAVAGPPAVLLGAPLVLMALMVAGPVVLILTGVALLAGVVGLGGAVLAAPYLLLRVIRSRRARPRPAYARRPVTLVPAASRRRTA
jgi:hypothetical protein